MCAIITDRDAAKARKKREWTAEERQIVYDLFSAWDKVTSVAYVTKPAYVTTSSSRGMR